MFHHIGTSDPRTHQTTAARLLQGTSALRSFWRFRQHPLGAHHRRDLWLVYASHLKKLCLVGLRQTMFGKYVYICYVCICVYIYMYII